MIDMLLFAMGRYLSLASSRGDLALPATSGHLGQPKPAMELRLPRQHQPPDELLGAENCNISSAHMPFLNYPSKMAATQ